MMLNMFGGGQGGALTLEIGQNSSFWPWTNSIFVPPFTNLMSKMIPFAYHLSTLVEQFQSKEPLYNVYGG